MLPITLAAWIPKDGLLLDLETSIRNSKSLWLSDLVFFVIASNAITRIVDAFSLLLAISNSLSRAVSPGGNLTKREIV